VAVTPALITWAGTRFTDKVPAEAKAASIVWAIATVLARVDPLFRSKSEAVSDVAHYFSITGGGGS